jgi:hypothetical protein
MLAKSAASAPSGSNNAGYQPTGGPGLDDPSSNKLHFPVACSLGRTCALQNYVDLDPGPGAADYKGGTRSYDGHNGTDIRLRSFDDQREGVPVLAAADGVVRRVRDGVPDISIRDLPPGAVAGKECGNGIVIDHAGGLQTQYCHLAKGSIKVSQGDRVPAGSELALVGLSGQTEYPHLHFTVRKDGAVVDPFRPDADEAALSPQGPLWSANSGMLEAYKDREVVNIGLTAKPVTMEDVTEHGSHMPWPAIQEAPALVGFVQVMGLKVGDVQHLKVLGPEGEQIASTTSEPLAADQAQSLLFTGKRRLQGLWARGTYTVEYSIKRGGLIVLHQRHQAQI